MSAMASMASSAWLVTTTSDCPASSRASSAKHSVPNGHRVAPRHSRADTLTCDQERSGTPGLSSSRSPVLVVSAQSLRRCTSRPSALAAKGSNNVSGAS
ncbi:Uncharacterised protein [Mycobacteroides abscessus subsp. massiliense]|nr:Uncharacterised protein [Mycobacteroides abscessus subsp. massiliense]